MPHNKALTAPRLFEVRTAVSNILGLLELSASAGTDKDRNHNILSALQQTRILARELRGESPTTQTVSEQAAPGIEATQQAVAPTSRILLAEDNAINQKIVTALLRKEGYEIIQVTNGKDALAAATNEAFDLVLMDIQMPIMDGLDATSFIRSHFKQQGEGPKGYRLPIIALTACEPNELPFIEEMMDGIIQKPFDTTVFLDTVKFLIEQAPLKQKSKETARAS